MKCILFPIMRNTASAIHAVHFIEVVHIFFTVNATT